VTSSAPLLEVEALEVRAAHTPLVEGVSLTLRSGRVHALVGESGSGKTLSCLALLQVLPSGLSATAGRFVVQGAPVAFGSPAHRALRGRTVSMMVQDSSASLDPVMRVGRQLDEILKAVAGVGRAELSIRREAVLRDVGFPEPALVVPRFPHELSGGMRQRVSLALSLAAAPKVLIADEPTTALDASLRGGVLALLRELARDRGLAVVMITHDLDAAEAIADDVTVLYAGRIAETGVAAACFAQPRHPYTAGLLAARPRGRTPPVPIPGSLPPISERLEGCRFAPRCARATAQCDLQPPLDGGVACVHPLERSP
jgi:oligopeptide/dipeptide ABC transporter ATP-binding protein